MRRKVRVALLDLYEGQPNEGMRCLREILTHYGHVHHLDLHFDVFEVRLECQVPDLSYDAYISSGGPGSPLESVHSLWENHYFAWLKELEAYNGSPHHPVKKHVFFICHSFQLACRHYRIGHVTKRKSTAFGVFPMHIQHWGKVEPVFQDLKDPFFAVDSRDYQVISPNHARLHEMGATILAIEKERPHVPLERAVMAIRFSPYMIGTQFHPEADAVGMSMYLQREDKKHTVITNYGEPKWKSMLEHLHDPDKIRWTYSHVIPNFLKQALSEIPDTP